ncbi:hypothetical protein [Vagococcus acidifermentans]|uniref:Uncharacterized protein n=1 Tax=Vagococcus acidifermentans TaxID=564710 RepID=A0A430B2T6_9ENTE|nr:hypothetical protein [Vagococcus acidifermentans]RSU14618.1 hypothetical protein CBF27_01140 [Vagococcus acidifermentans]
MKKFVRVVLLVCLYYIGKIRRNCDEYIEISLNNYCDFKFFLNFPANCAITAAIGGKRFCFQTAAVNGMIEKNHLPGGMI